MSNTKWYEDENLVNLSRKCDEVYFDQDEEGMCILVDECYRQAHDLKNTNMIRARYFYISFTIQSDLIDLKRKKSRNNYKDSIKSLKFYETDFQKSLYLARNAFELLANEMEEDNNISQNELIYMISFQWQLSVNYANFFYQNGRLVKAVEILSIFNSKNVFPMGMAQLGMKLCELACCHYDGGQRTIMLYKAYHYIKQAIESDEPFPEKAEMDNLLNYYSDDIFMASSGGGFAYHEAEDYSETEKYDFEKNLLGIGVTPHPLQNLARRFEGNFTPLAQLVKNRRMTILVEINYIRTHRTKTGQTMAFLTVSDSRENFDVTLFPEIYRQFSGELEQGKFYLISGKVTERNDELQLVTDRISPALETDRKLWLNLRDDKYNQKISQILREFPGSHQVILHYSNLKKTIQTKIYVEESEILQKRLEGYVIAGIYK